MLDNITYIAILLTCSIFIYKRLKTLMLFYQQEEYDNIRFIKYSFNRLKLVDKKLTTTLLFLQLVIYLTKTEQCFIYIPLILLFFIFLEQNPCLKGKKKLVFTVRVKRILFIAALNLALIMFFSLKFDNYLILVLIILIQLLPLILVCANIILAPYENKLQSNYLNDAKQKLALCKPQIIAITGSYGKTSTKHILAHILASIYPTLITPASVNTLMGITRIIREKLTPEHQYFIVEMGAYGINSIKSLCNLTPPNYGIITAVGNAHYERFKNIENVAQAKFELSDAVAVKQGKTLVNIDAIAHNFINKYGKNIVKIGSASAAEYQIDAVRQTDKGLNFNLKHAKNTYLIETPLFGLQHTGNIALAFALAHQLGLEPDIIIATLKSLPQIEHRLEVIKKNGAATIIDDAYNANPTGFIAALEILTLLKKPKGRRILVTPGLVELGNLHVEKHSELGKISAKHVDIALIICSERIQSFVINFNKYKNNQQLLYDFPNFAAAKKWLELNATANDVILYENDLPDLYENKLSL
ncbi:MAG: Mur ligase family protein [Rickettsiales bacterium]